LTGLCSLSLISCLIANTPELLFGKKMLHGHVQLLFYHHLGINQKISQYPSS
jgi:hypothetical protein